MQKCTIRLGLTAQRDSTQRSLPTHTALTLMGSPARAPRAEARQVEIILPLTPTYIQSPWRRTKANVLDSL